MIFRPEITMRDTILFYLAALRDDASLADGVFENWEEDEIADIADYFATQVIPVRLGYPKATPEVPAIYCMAGMAQETLQLIGGTLSEVETSSVFTEQQGSFFQMRTRAMCVAQNANLTVVLQSIALWSMLAERPTLGDLPISQQNLSISDFEPVPQFFPDTTYRRDVMWSALIAQTIPREFGKIASISVTARTPQNLESVTVVTGR